MKITLVIQAFSEDHIQLEYFFPRQQRDSSAFPIARICFFRLRMSCCAVFLIDQVEEFPDFLTLGSPYDIAYLGFSSKVGPAQVGALSKAQK